MTEICGVNMRGGAEGDGGLIEGISVFIGTSPSGDLGDGKTTAAVAIFESSFPLVKAASSPETFSATVDVSER